jgi:hypothetical protein
MSAEKTISISPKQRFLDTPAQASSHSDLMASPVFQSAASSAMLAYQFKVASCEPSGLTIAAAKLRGAQEFLHILLNLGLPESRTTSTVDSALVPPEESLKLPYQPPIP